MNTHACRYDGQVSQVCKHPEQSVGHMHDTGGEIEAQSLSLRPWLQAAIVCLLAAGAGGVFWYGQSHKLDAAEVVKTRAAFTPAAGNSFVLTPAQLATVTTETVKPRRFHEEITT